MNGAIIQRSRVITGRALFAALTIGGSACANEAHLPLEPVAGEAHRGPTRGPSAPVYWNEVARSLVIENRSSAPFAIRGYAVVSLAQYNAAVAAEKLRRGPDHPAVRAAIASASVAALTYLYPTAEAALEERLDGYLDANRWPGGRHGNVETGEEIGREIAAAVVERARNDRFFASGSLPVPTGDGVWFSDRPPVGSLWGQAETYFTVSGAQFRPPPPPAFGSSAFLAGLAEVRAISDTRTPEQDASARFWDQPAGTYTPPGYWNEEAAKLATRYRLGEREAAHLFALMNMVSYDGIVASHNAKYHYWLLRPTMADPGITLSIPLPNFPSYPSNHATISAGMARILAHRFPAHRRRLAALAEEAAVSRVLGGIHYRFDGEAGLKLGRQIADWAIEHDVGGRQPYPLDID